MGEDESDEHLKIFECLVNTGALVLRSSLESKVLHNIPITFEQYLENTKHQFYHQFERNRNKPCCSGQPHNCYVNGNMDKKIFYKVYNKIGESDKQHCLDRFEVNAGVSIDKLDLSDLNFFLWNSNTLSQQEVQSLQTIMTIRSAICHPQSTQCYTINDLEQFWVSLQNAVLLFAEPDSYKKIVTLLITTQKRSKVNKIESNRIINEMRTESEKILREFKLEAQAKTELISNVQCLKEETAGLKNFIINAHELTKSCLNDRVQELTDTNDNHCKSLLKSTEEMKDDVKEDNMKTRNQSERHFKSLEAKLTENKENHYKTFQQCSEGIETKLTQEGIKTRNHNKEHILAIDENLKDAEKRFCQTVSHFHGLTEDKIIEKANETRKHSEGLHSDLIEKNRQLTDKVMKMETDLNEVKTLLIGITGNQKIQLEMNCEQMEKLVTTTATKEIYMTGKVNQTCLTEDKARRVIENIPSKIEVPTDRPVDATRQEIVTIIAKKVGSVILELKSTPGIFESVKNLKLAILTIVQNMQIAGDIDTGVEDTVTVKLEIQSPLTLDQIAVLKCLFANEKDDIQPASEYLPTSITTRGLGNLGTKTIETQMESWQEILDLLGRNKELTAKVDKKQTNITEIKKSVIGVIGKQNVELLIVSDKIEQLTTSSDTQEVYITISLNQKCMSADKVLKFIDMLPEEKQKPNNSPLDPFEKETINIMTKEVNIFIFKLKTPPGIFKSEETFRSAMNALVQHLQIAELVNIEPDDTLTVKLKIESPLTEDQIAVAKCLFTNESNDANTDSELSVEHPTTSSKEIAQRNLNPTRNTSPIMACPDLDTNSQKVMFLHQIVNLSIEVLYDGQANVKAPDNKSKGYHVLWQITTPHGWDVDEVEAKLKHPIFNVEMVIIGFVKKESIVMMTTVSAPILNDQEAFKTAVKSFMNNLVDVSHVDTLVHAQVDVRLHIVFSNIMEPGVELPKKKVKKDNKFVQTTMQSVDIKIMEQERAAAEKSRNVELPFAFPKRRVLMDNKLVQTNMTGDDIKAYTIIDYERAFKHAMNRDRYPIEQERAAVTKTTHPSGKQLSSAKDVEPTKDRRGGSSFLKKLRIGKYNKKPDQVAHVKTISKEISASQESKCVPSLSGEVASPQNTSINWKGNVARSAPTDTGKLSEISEIDKSHQTCVSFTTLPDDIENKILKKT